MSYSTATSLLLILPGLPQTSTSTGYTSTVAIIEGHISRADNIINGKIAGLYAITTFATSVPPLLKTISEDITSYFSYRSFFSGDNQNENEWTDKFKDSMDLLDMVRKGDMVLVDSAGNVVDIRSSTGSGQECESTTEDYTPTFGEDSTLDWDVDSDKLDDLAGDRG